MSEPRHPLHAWRWPIVVMFAMALAAFFAFQVMFRAERAVRDVAASTRGSLEGLRKVEITETFLSSLPDVTGRGPGRLEVASLVADETIRREDERRVLWDMLPLGSTVAEIRVPVVYRYHVRFDEPWNLELQDQTLVVSAPELRPTLPPAIRTDNIRKRVESDWLRFDGAQQMAELERSLTRTLETYAQDPRRLSLVREEARQTVAGFVRAWLVDRKAWGDEGVQRIVVRFADEATPADQPVVSWRPVAE